MDNCHGGSCNLKLAKMYVIEKCCNGYIDLVLANIPRGHYSCKHSLQSLTLRFALHYRVVSKTCSIYVQHY